MDILPAIDLYRGACVRLLRGDFATAKHYSDDPLAQARAWSEQGALWLHLVDLDGAEGSGDNRQHIAAIAGALPQLRIQVGGGIRTPQAVRQWLDAGVERVILGTAAIRDPAFLESACAEHPGKIVLALDFLDDRVRIAGWKEEGPALADMAEQARSLPLAALLCTDIGRDGTLEGPALDQTRALADSQPHPVLLSGGIGSLDDLQAAAATGKIAGAICGKALYEGRFSLAEALRTASGGQL